MHKKVEFEWKQWRIEQELLEQQHKEEREEDRRRHEEELHEMRRRDSNQQQRMNNFLQFAMTGLMAYMGVKLQNNDDNSKPPGQN